MSQERPISQKLACEGSMGRNTVILGAQHIDGPGFDDSGCHETSQWSVGEQPHQHYCVGPPPLAQDEGIQGTHCNSGSNRRSQGHRPDEGSTSASDNTTTSPNVSIDAQVDIPIATRVHSDFWNQQALVTAVAIVLSIIVVVVSSATVAANRDSGNAANIEPQATLAPSLASNCSYTRYVLCPLVLL